MSHAKHYTAEHCGIRANVTLTPPDDQPWSEEPPGEVPSVCIICSERIVLTPATRWEHERLTALEDDCKNCGESISFLADLLMWVHDQNGGEGILDPGYGVRGCDELLEALLGMPAPQYAGMVAEPTNTHVTLDLLTGESETSEEQAQKQKQKAKKAAKKKEQKAAVLNMSPSLRKSLGG